MVAALLVGVTACSSGGPSASPAAPAAEPTAPARDPRAGGTLAMGIGADVTDLAPTGQPWTPAELQVARSVYDRLAVYDAGHQLQPQLASAFKPNTEHTEWTIELRPGITFHDGTPLDANAVRDNLEAQRASATWGPLLAPIRSVFVRGPLTVAVASAQPWSTFPHVLAGQVGYVAAPRALADPSLALAPVGTGPFVIDQVVPERAIGLRRNEAYWQAGQPLLDRVDLQLVADPAARAAAFEAGTLAVAQVDAPLDLGTLSREAAAGDIQLVLDREAEAPKLTVVLNTVRPPFVDVGARSAMDMGTDRQALARIGFDGVLRPAHGPVVDESVWFNGQPVNPRDDAAATREAVRYAERYGQPLAFSLLVPAEPVALRYAAAWQAQLARVGVQAEVVPLAVDEVARRTALGEFQAAMVPLFDTWHPDLWYPALHRSDLVNVGVAGTNLPRFGTEAIDEGLDAARATTDLALQVDHYRTVQAELLASDAYLFLVRLPRAVSAQTQVHDLTSWSTADGRPGLGTEGGTVSLAGVWLDR